MFVLNSTVNCIDMVLEYHEDMLFDACKNVKNIILPHNLPIYVQQQIKSFLNLSMHYFTKFG